MSNFVIRDSQPDDLVGIAALQADVEPALQVSPAEYSDVWRWLCRQNPVGQAKVLSGADAAGAIAAHEAVIPFPIVHDGQTRVGGLACLVVVAQAWRQSPLFLSIERRMLREYPAAGIDFVFAVVRDYMVKAHSLLGFRVLTQFPVYARPYRLGKLAGRYLHNRLAMALASPLLRVAECGLRARVRHRARGIEVLPVGSLDETDAASLEAVCASLGLHSRRTGRLLEWRYRQCPGRQYQVYAAREKSATLGYVALRRMAMHEFDALAIVDLVFPPERPEVGKALLRAAHGVAVDSGVDLAAGVFNPRSPLLPVIKSCGFLRTPEAYNLIVHQPRAASPPIEDEAFRNWHYTWFEHDYV